MFTPLITNDYRIELILYAYMLAAVIQFVYIWIIFGRFAFFKKRSQPLPVYPPVSVVIAAKNEYYNLNRNLPLILSQEYPDFEVVVVNDASDDDSPELLKNFSREHANLNVLTIQENLNFFHGKKFPLALGIKAAKNELLLLTDADCRPSGSFWIRDMMSNFEDKKTQIVIGFGGYERKPGLLNKIIRFDTLNIAMQYFSMALNGNPYMGVGRNLAYRKSFFNEKKGFIAHYQIPSGDDDLFVNSNATRNNTTIEWRPESQTVSYPKTSFSAWWTQKKRHLKTGKFYKFKHKSILGMHYVSQISFFALLAVLLVFTRDLTTLCVILGILAVRVFSQLLVVKKSMNKLKEKNLLLFSPVFELFFMIINPLLALSNIFDKENRWK